MIDACAFPAWPGTAALVEYMDDPWPELLMRPGDPGGPIPLLSNAVNVDPRARTSRGQGGDELVEHLRDVGSTRCMVLGWDDGLLSTAIPDPRRAEVVVRAANDWLVDQWLSDDRAVFGMMLIPSALPDVAASEIRRIGRDQRIVAVALGCNALGRPFGDRIYLPIFEAAVEMGLPVVLQIGSDNATDQITPPVAGGVPATYAEYRVLSVHSHMAHLGSMIVEGLFERMPELQVLLIGGGFTWIPGWLWRVGAWTKQWRRTQAPWLRRLPAEYFVEHVKVTSDSLERPRHGERLERALEAIPGLERTLVFASCFPRSDCEGPEEIVGVVARWLASGGPPRERSSVLSLAIRHSDVTRDRGCVTRLI